MQVPFTPYGKFPKSGFSNKFRKIDNIGVLMLIYVWAFFESWEVDATMIAVIQIGKEDMQHSPYLSIFQLPDSIKNIDKKRKKSFQSESTGIRGLVSMKKNIDLDRNKNGLAIYSRYNSYLFLLSLTLIGFYSLYIDKVEMYLYCMD